MDTARLREAMTIISGRKLAEFANLDILGYDYRPSVQMIKDCAEIVISAIECLWTRMQNAEDQLEKLEGKVIDARYGL